jgi:hypothetical protein
MKRKIISTLDANNRMGRKLNQVDNSSLQILEDEKIIYAISAGVVLILIGVVFALAQPANLWDEVIAFFSSFTLAEVPRTDLIVLPSPIAPSAHAILYRAVFQFSLGLGIFQVLLLILRLKIKSTNKKIAETLASLIFWLGSSYLVIRFLNNSTSINIWFIFWAGILMILGLSFLARGFVLYATRN